MLPTASHTISTLTESVPISGEEAGVWTKMMKHAIELKIKMTNSMMPTMSRTQFEDMKNFGYL